MLEKIVESKISLLLNSVFIDEQYGFIERRSTASNSLVYERFLLYAIEKEKQVDAVYTDSANISDKVIVFL